MNGCSRKRLQKCTTRAELLYMSTLIDHEKLENVPIKSTIDFIANGVVSTINVQAAYYTHETGTYFFIQKEFNSKLTYIYVGHTGSVDGEKYRFVVVEFIQLIGLVDNPKHFILYGDRITPHLFADVVLSLIWKLRLVESVPCYIDKVAPDEELANLPDLVVPEGYELGHLQENDVEHVNKRWKYATAGTDAMIRDRIAKFPTTAVRHNGELVGWLLSSEDSQIFHLYVEEEHRGKRLGLVLTNETLKKMLRFGMPKPHAHIVHENYTQLKIMDQRRIHKDEYGLPILTYWYVFTPDNNACRPGRTDEK